MTTADAASRSRRAAVLGCGVWGKAFAVAVADRLRPRFWDRHPDSARQAAAAVNSSLEKNSESAESGDERASWHAELEGALDGAELVIVAVSSGGFSETMQRVARFFPSSPPPVLWLTKGFVGEDRLLSEEAEATLPPGSCFGALSGPTFAAEIEQGLPAAMALALNAPGRLVELQALLHRRRLRLYPEEDLLGVCVGGAMKNIVAVAAGVCDGLAMGANARAALITRGLAEMAAFNRRLGGGEKAMAGAAGVGDLILTCCSDLSRNRRLGIALGQGLPPPQFTAEGATAADKACRRAEKMGLELPVCAAVRDILQNNIAPKQAAESLLSRPPPGL